jgi:hypothetical protein
MDAYRAILRKPALMRLVERTRHRELIILKRILERTDLAEDDNCWALVNTVMNLGDK